MKVANAVPALVNIGPSVISLPILPDPKLNTAYVREADRSIK